MKRFVALAAACALVCACGSPDAGGPRPDPEIVEQTDAAVTAYAAGAYARAARYYELALRRARAMDKSEEIARNAYNAAACHLRAGKPEAAEPLLVEARREFPAAGLDIPRVVILQARTADALGRKDEAAALIAGVLKVATNRGDKVEALSLQVDVAIAKNRLDDAGADARRAITAANADGSPRLRAIAHGAEGRVAMARGKPVEAAKAYDRQVALSKTAGDYSAMACALSDAGSALAAAGQNEAAADHFYRSARSHLGLRNHIASLRALERAAKAADAGNNAGLRQQVAALMVQVREAVAREARETP